MHEAGRAPPPSRLPRARYCPRPLAAPTAPIVSFDVWADRSLRPVREVGGGRERRYGSGVPVAVESGILPEVRFTCAPGAQSNAVGRAVAPGSLEQPDAHSGVPPGSCTGRRVIA